jgi:glycosyltransferase EpsD
MPNKILFCATVDYHFKAFHLPYMEWFKKQGWEVHVAANGSMNLPFVDEKYNLPITRSPFSLKNLKAYGRLKQIIEENDYKIIHCHTPVGGVLARLAARGARKKGTKVIYTAHGFHFCKGAPVQNWLVYYPVERWMAKFTDCLVTINNEDHSLASAHGFKVPQVQHIHGVGVDTDRFKPVSVEQKLRMREALGYKENEFILFYAGEFNRNKNQMLLIQALASVKEKIPNAKLLLAGNGSMLEQCKKHAAKLGVEDRIEFMGFRSDIEHLLKIADIAVSSSNREGLPVNVMEAMACGLPVIATHNRGHSELIINDKNGYIVPRNNDELFGNRIYNLYSSPEIRKTMGEESRKRIKPYSLNEVGEELGRLYSAYMMEDIHETESQYHRAYL